MASTLSIQFTFISQIFTKFPTHPASSSYSTHFPPLRFSKKPAPPLSFSNSRLEKSTVKKASGAKEQKLVHEGLITESLPNGMFRVKLENGDVILGHISGRIRKSFIRILPGDKVKIEVSRHLVNSFTWSVYLTLLKV